MSVVFESKRLRCRRWIPNDVEPLFAVYSDQEGARWIDDGRPITYAECDRWLRVTEANYAKRGYGMFALESRASGQVIGFCGLVHPNNQAEPEIKYAFLSTYWGQGYASEAVPALLAYGASTHGLTRIIATVAKGNLASQRVLLKSGMVYSHTIEEENGAEEEDEAQTLLYEWHSCTARTNPDRTGSDLALVES